MPTLRSALQALNVDVESFDPQDDDPLICPACHKLMKTPQGITAHLQTAKSCQWYKKGKLRELTLPGRFGEEVMAREVDEQMVLPRQEPELDPMEVVEEYGQHMYNLIPPNDEDHIGRNCGEGSYHDAQQETGEGEEDVHIIEEHLLVGRVIRVDETLHQLWRRRFGEEKAEGEDVDMDDTSQLSSSYNTFSSFASELDWRVAHWAVSEGIGHKSFDRLMNIPSVSLTKEGSKGDLRNIRNSIRGTWICTTTMEGFSHAICRQV
ncbi:uncharacterized protein F5147DRAFT_562725 [Suillus discolor]|uniref:Uncharacterized protein n=1 Tax=Suillus discolor TaxID=1912936 RepID=A0A9P7FKD6_9AGAM|nr:uncharacterized protein F5147DRAFT_562725 [Suillus discolor]KAG2121043.1 hypothetical protein F5147DRAFT_562725 [Suillus discolor]